MILLGGIWIHTFAAASTYFCVFLVSLVHRFSAAGRYEDRAYALTLLVFLIIYTAYLFVKIIHWWVSLWRCASGYLAEKEKSHQLTLAMTILVCIFLAGDIAVNILFLVRLWQWFAEFRAVGEMGVAIPCAALGVQFIIHIAVELVGLARTACLALIRSSLN